MSARSRRLGCVTVVWTLGLGACGPDPPRMDRARECLPQADRAANWIAYNERPWDIPAEATHGRVGTGLRS